MIMTKKDLYEQVCEIQLCIHNCTVDLLDDPKATKIDSIKAVVESVHKWERRIESSIFKEDLYLQGCEIRHCIQHFSIDLLDDRKATKNDIIVAAYLGIKRWQKGMLIIIEEEGE
jgi:hypothetical protein